MEVELEDAFNIFIICFMLFSLNLFLVIKIKDKLIPVFFLIFGSLVYVSTFYYTESSPIYLSISLLLLFLGIYINAKGVELL